MADEPGTDGSSDRGWTARVLVIALAVFVGGAIAVPFALSGTARSKAPERHAPLDHPVRLAQQARDQFEPPTPETVTSISPAAGATGVQPDATIQLDFSQPLAAGGPEPTLSPAVPGNWDLESPTELVFTPSASLVPSTTYTVTVPEGVRARRSPALVQAVSVSFTVAPGSVLRLQQLLATLGYLPLEFDGIMPPAQDMAVAQPGTFAWRDQGFPTAMTSQWSPTQFNALTKGAVMALETQNGLVPDGVAGPAVWAALLADVAGGKQDAEPVTYVLVSKGFPQHLTVWVNGVLTFADVPCNTGVPGATTIDGTFQVFSHVEVSNMRGTDVTGSHYDVTVPWASYFDGGQALHGYPRASYGFPQSNGCVEMPIPTAGRVWPDTPIGTMVTVVGA